MSEQNASDGQRLIAELWYAEVPDLGRPALLAALRQVSAATELRDGSLTVPHPELTLDADDGAAPLLTAVLPGSALGHEGKAKPDVSQTWDWAEASAALDRCSGSLLVTELMARGFAPQQRVDALMAVLQVLIQHTSPEALSWPHSQRVTDPELFDPEALDGILNVRFFSVDDDAMVMDTVGMDIFELPDTQCHYRDYSPGDVAALLFTTAAYVFAEGDVIDDGDTVSGPRGDERFVCRHERALIPPAREVLDVDLGEPFAAGRRRG